MTENKRIIKFRAWDKRKKKMIFGPTDDNVSSAWVFTMAEVGSPYDDMLVLMQSTCLVDRNGKEIYEGDIIRSKNGKLWVIEWKDYGWCINNHLIADPKAKFAGPETYGFAYWMRLHPEGHCDVEIIGSLYENPELIKS